MSSRSLEDGQQLIEVHKPEEASAIRSLILEVAREKGEVHADDIPHPGNVVGAQFNALAKMGRLEKLNRHGQVEHRKSTNPASHGRASYVWRLAPQTSSAPSAGDGSGLRPLPETSTRVSPPVVPGGSGASEQSALAPAASSPAAAGHSSPRVFARGPGRLPIKVGPQQFPDREVNFKALSIVCQKRMGATLEGCIAMVDHWEAEARREREAA